MVVIDTNVLIYAASSSEPEREGCLEFLEARRRGVSPWFMTWSIVYEFLRVSTHRRVWPNPWPANKALDFVGALLESESLQMLMETPRHSEILASVVRDVPLVAGNFVHDAHIATLMREHGVRTIATRDTGFHRFPFLDVLDPLV